MSEGCLKADFSSVPRTSSRARDCGIMAGELQNHVECGVGGAVWTVTFTDGGWRH
jgi:hypothetical protein